MKAELVRVIVDTNVWISAALSPNGTPARLVQHVLSAALPVFSAATFQELETRIWKPKFDRYLSIETRRRILHDLDAAALWVEVPPDIAAARFSRDPDDDRFIHAALASRAPYLISGDQDLLSVQPLAGLAILSPNEATEALKGIS